MSSINFLFWNIYNKDNHKLLYKAIKEFHIDICALCEFKSLDQSSLFSLIQSNLNKTFVSAELLGSKRILLLHDANISIAVLTESHLYSTFRILGSCASDDLILNVVHLNSKKSYDDNELSYKCYTVAAQISEIEAQQKLDRTAVIGDFNQSPFDIGLIAPGGFNAVMCKDIAKKVKRTSGSVAHKFFYNPMWHLMGNHGTKTKGTYYYDSRPNCYYWYTFDQLLLRSELIPSFDINKLQILDKISEISLVDKLGKPNKAYSDHLPIIFTL